MTNCKDVNQLNGASLDIYVRDVQLPALQSQLPRTVSLCHIQQAQRKLEYYHSNVMWIQASSGSSIGKSSHEHPSVHWPNLVPIPNVQQH